MTAAERVELDRILAKQSPADALVLSGMLERPWEKAQRRIALRNEALEAAAWLLPDAPLTVRAKDLARRLARHAERRHRPAATDPLHLALAAVLALDAGRAVAWRVIYDVLRNSLLAAATAEADGSDHARPQTGPAARIAVACVGDAAH